MEYIKIENEIIIEHVSSKALPAGFVQVGPGNQVRIGLNVNRFNSDWTLKSNQSLIDDGVIILENNQVIEGGKIITLTVNEMYKRGLTPLPDNLVIDGDKVREKTPDELYNSGVIDLTVWNNLKKQLYKNLRIPRLAHFGAFIKPMKDGEDDGVADGIIEEADRVLSAGLYRVWLIFQNHESRRHNTIDWTALNFSDIHLGNSEIFPALPEFPDEILP